MSARDLFNSDYRFLKLLEFSPFERRIPTSGTGGGWRFGTRRIADSVVARLIASGRARQDGGRIVGVRPA